MRLTELIKRHILRLKQPFVHTVYRIVLYGFWRTPSAGEI